MGLNLQWLHDDAKKNLYSTRDGENLVHLEVLGARTRLGDLYLEHGEELLEFLEGALKSFEATQEIAIYPTDHWAPRAKRLLAQLEREARR